LKIAFNKAILPHLQDFYEKPRIKIIDKVAFSLSLPPERMHSLLHPFFSKQMSVSLPGGGLAHVRSRGNQHEQLP
jgi:hypothetical protein